MSTTEASPKLNPPPPASSWELLKYAASQGDITKIQFLLKAKVLPNPDVPGETTPLMWAAHNGHANASELLIQANAHIDASSSDNGWTALMHAAANDKTRVMKVLVEASASLDQQGSDGNTALILAAQKGHDAAVKLLVKAGANVCVADNAGRRALSWAVSEGHLVVVKTLSDAEASQSAAVSGNEDVLMLAARKGSVDITRALINKKNAQSIAVAKSAMATAAREGSLDVMKRLVEAKAPSHEQTDSQYCNSLLQLAAANGHWSIMDYLLRLNSRKKGFNFDQYRACMTAARKGHVSVVCELTDTMYAPRRSVSYNTDDLFLGAVDAAALAGQCDVLYVLIDAVDVDQYWDPDFGIFGHGNKPLLSAAEGGHVPAVKYLLKKGFYVNITGRGGNTPLMIAAERGHADVVRVLVEYNAELDDTNDENQTAWELAMIKGNKEVLKILAPEFMNVDYELLISARWRDAGVVSVFIDAQADVNASYSPTGETPLMLAAKQVEKKQSLPVIKLLIESGADITMKNSQGQTALLCAASEGRVDAFRALVEAGADATVCDNNGRNALMLFAACGCADGIKDIIGRIDG